jgi:GT2 family glycosyltransferase
MRAPTLLDHETSQVNVQRGDDYGEVVRQVAPSQAPAVKETDETHMAQLSESLAETHARLTAAQTEARELAHRLTLADLALSRKRAMLNWIISSRSWKLTSPLRQLKFFGERSRARLLKSTEVVGELESPGEGSLAPGSVEISGWAYSTAAPIVGIDAFIDGMPLGTLYYGQPRPDISAYPLELPLNCGYRGKFLIDESFVGKQKLVVRISDRRGNISDHSRMLTIQQPRNGLCVPVFSPQEESLAASLPSDDLSTARRLQTSVGRISLQTFLVSNTVLYFPKFDQPEISIILVLHNRAELTLQCLYSILQSYARPFEVIIVNNASSDETASLLKRVDGVRLIHNQRNLHYLLACNQASEEAKGDYLLLLNNDAQLQSHSIVSALSTFESSDDIGAVGGKVILPDGTLQEAGSIVWSDGSCLGYGRGSAPQNPAFMFRRDVDYCSAVFLLTKRDLFLGEGGFDQAYVPAYYEETDYCVKLWRQGKRVVYDPDVTVWHHELASSATSEAAIDLQTKHRTVFVSRHHDWLDKQLAPSPVNILAARTRRRPGAKRIIILDDRVPHTWLGSGFPRTNRIVRELVRLGHEVTCYPLTYSQEDWHSIYEDLPREVEVMINQGLPFLEQFLTERAGYYDIVFISRPHNMSNLDSLIGGKLFAGARIIYDAEALFALRHIEQKRIQGKRVSCEVGQSLLNKELRLAEGCDRVISVSKRESEEFLKAGMKAVYTLGHALEVTPTPNDFAERNDILFVGAIHEPDLPNADSVLWFSRKILPRIQKALGTEVNLIVAGVIHSEVEEQLDKRNIQVRGVVKDLTELYNECRIFVAPTRFSAGLPHKVHEAAAHGLPVVATALTGSQLGWDHDRDLLLAKDDDSFAAACIRLYQDQQLWQRLRGNALQRVAVECSPESFVEQLKAIIE